jgi:putative ABC transport system substrate-binding protein
VRIYAIVAGIYASINRIEALAQELVSLRPDIILAHGTSATFALQRETRTIPIVFASVGQGDPGGQHQTRVNCDVK